MKLEEFEEMNQRKEEKLKPSIEDPPKLDLKKLPERLEYVFLEEYSKFLVNIASNLEVSEKGKLLNV